MRDLFNNLAVVEAIAPATYAADNTPVAIDVRNLASAMLTIQAGIGGITFSGTNKIEFKLSHADLKADGSEPDAGDYVAVTQDDVQGVTVDSGGIVLALTAAHAASTLTRVGYIGHKSFLKLLADFGGTHGTGTPISAVLQGKPFTLPVAA
jgi:hypothetical protein